MGRTRGGSAVLDAPKTAEETAITLANRGSKCPKLSPANFWAATRAYERGAGTHYKVYRLFPAIDRRLTGETKKDILNYRFSPGDEDLNEERILSAFGAGDYQVYFVDSNAKPSSLAVTNLELSKELWERPPVLNQEELVVGHPKNHGYIEGLKARGLWRREQLQEERNDMGGVAAVSEAANTAVQGLCDLAKSAMQKSHEKQPTDAALHQAVDIMGTAYKSALSTIGQTGGDKGNGEMMLVVKMMQEQQQRQHEIFMEMLKQQGSRPAAAAPGIDGQLSVVTKMLEFARTLDGSGRPASWLDSLAPFAPALVALLSRATAPAPPAPYPGSLLMTPAPDAPVVPSLVGAAPPAAAVSPEDDPMFATVLASMGIPNDAIPFAKVLAKIGGRAVHMFRAGVSGYAFAADVERTEGEDTYGLIYSAGLAQLVELLTRFAPMLGADSAALIGSADFHSWLADFFHYGKQNGYEESDEEHPTGADKGPAE